MPRFLFITGKLAEPALRRVLAELGPRVGFEYAIFVLPITVVALATTSWIARHFRLTEIFDRILLPGLCQGDLAEFAGLPVASGPKDLRDLPSFFGSPSLALDQNGPYDIAILAEINHADRLDRAELLTKARQARTDGADIIDLGCTPGTTWETLGDAVQELRADDIRVSIDTFNRREAELGAKAGAELILSVNSENRDAAKDWGVEVVAVPDVPATLEGLDATMNSLVKAGVPFRIDPVLEPIAFGFAASLGRYLEIKRRYPLAEIMMGVGNLTELTDVDSAGVNVVLLGFCQEIGIRSVLTTEVINWCRSSIRELDLARRLVFHAVTNQVLPKNVATGLVLLRDPRLPQFGQQTLQELHEQITDKNFRLFAERGLLHIINNDMFLQGTDPFALFREVIKRTAVDAEHAFYLGYELAKAQTALTLGKNYIQDQALRWGFLTAPENTERASVEG